MHTSENYWKFCSEILDNNPTGTTYILRVRKYSSTGTDLGLIIDNMNVGTSNQYTVPLAQHGVLDDMCKYQWNISAVPSGTPIPQPGQPLSNYPDVVTSANNSYRIGIIYAPVLGDINMGTGNSNIKWGFNQRKGSGHSYTSDEYCQYVGGNNNYFDLVCTENYKFNVSSI